jgi:hypothetical protein
VQNHCTKFIKLQQIINTDPQIYFYTDHCICGLLITTAVLRWCEKRLSSEAHTIISTALPLLHRSLGVKAQPYDYAEHVIRKTVYKIRVIFVLKCKRQMVGSLVKSELERMWKETVVFKFNIISRHLSRAKASKALPAGRIRPASFYHARCQICKLCIHYKN